jgi:hypothetical protein
MSGATARREREQCDSRASDLVKRRDRAPYTETDPACHLMQFHHAVCEEDQHGAVIGSACHQLPYEDAPTLIQYVDPNRFVRLP